MTTEEVTIDQLRERLVIYKQESNRLKQTFLTKQLPLTKETNTVSQLRQLQDTKIIDSKVNLDYDKHLQNTNQTINKWKRSRREKIIFIALLLAVIFILIDPLVKLLCLSKFVSRYKLSFEGLIPLKYFLQTNQIQKTFGVVLFWFKRILLLDWEIPS